MRIAAVGDVHGREFLEPFQEALADIPDPELFLLAGDLTDHNRIEEFGEVLVAVRNRTDSPVVCVFGNNEYGPDHEKYRQKFDAVFLEDEDHVFEFGGRKVRVIGSTGALDEPTWWQRNNLPGIAQEYEARIRKLDQLLAGDDARLLLLHYPPTHVTMGGEKEAWRPQLGSRRLERVVLRRMADLVVHGHVHKGIPFAELSGGRSTIEEFSEDRKSIPVFNVAFPVTHKVTMIEV